ncbi:MAG: ImmA/IrrE family metallo-endopeptidase [Spirochaetota bacterium]|jgi:Zn-dependent peptidase ImmA (M78 family)|nr:ImmA/IrrE family metallo-endopeptidase [Spirochaetota bacterium]
MIENQPAYRAFRMAHEFLQELNIRWFPVDPFEIVHKKPEWRLVYAHNLAAVIDKDENYLRQYVLRSEDGMAAYDPQTKQYCIVLNYSGKKPFYRLRWTLMHEIAHIYLGHLDNKRDSLSEEDYIQMEFEANVFTAEVLASKWILREMGITDKKDIELICDISGIAASKRYKKVTEEYDYRPSEADNTIRNFEQYLKEITICKPLEALGEFQRFAHVLQELPESGKCSFCGNNQGISPRSLFCTDCGKPLRASLQKRETHCGHINHESAVYCELCGNKVFRIRQGLCFEECEII